MFEDFNYNFEDGNLEIVNKNPCNKTRLDEADLIFPNSTPKKIKLDEFANENHTGNTSKNNSCISPTKVVERRFPGPAGLLSSKPKETNEEVEDIQFLCSQQTHSLYENGPWSEMVKDFKSEVQNEQLYEKFSISWIKSNSCKGKLLVNQKAPFLAAVVDNLEIIDGKIRAINLTLKDKTGVIKSSVLHSLYDEYNDYFTTGSVLVLKRFGVLSIQKDPCITITPNNLLIIYHNDVIKDECTDRGSVKKIVISQYNVDEIWENYHESVKKHQQQLNKQISNFKGNGPTTFSKTVATTPLRSNAPKLCDIPNNVKQNSTSDAKKKIAFKNVGTPKDFIEKNCEEKSADNTLIVETSNCSQISVKSDKEHVEIWKDLFEEIDADSLFDDF